MNLTTNQKLIVMISIVSIVGVSTAVYDSFLSGPDLSLGDKKVLVLAIDEGEPREGMGAVDMGFIIEMKNGTIKKSTPFYPGGKTHPSESEPAAAGVGGNLLMHDSFWYADNSKSMRLAKEIVEYHTGEKIDVVVAINTKAVDAIIEVSKPIVIKNQTLEISAIDFVREEQNDMGLDRGAAVKALSSALIKGTQDPEKRDKIASTIVEQYTAGNIVVDPAGSFLALLNSKL